MTTAEKAHAYDEALARANELYNRGYTSIPVDIFPELAESEDEKIRKELILFVKGNIQDEESEQRKDYLAWLEKHGEPNPFTGTGFKYNGHEYGMCARDGGVEITIDGNIADRVFSKDGKPIEWRVLDALIRRLEGEDIYVSPHLAAECLKSIKQRIKKGE